MYSTSFSFPRLFIEAQAHHHGIVMAEKVGCGQSNCVQMSAVYPHTYLQVRSVCEIMRDV